MKNSKTQEKAVIYGYLRTVIIGFAVVLAFGLTLSMAPKTASACSDYYYDDGCGYYDFGYGYDDYYDYYDYPVDYYGGGYGYGDYGYGLGGYGWGSYDNCGYCCSGCGQQYSYQLPSYNYYVNQYPGGNVPVPTSYGLPGYNYYVLSGSSYTSNTYGNNNWGNYGSGYGTGYGNRVGTNYGYGNGSNIGGGFVMTSGW